MEKSTPNTFKWMEWNEDVGDLEDIHQLSVDFKLFFLEEFGMPMKLIMMIY